VLPLQATGGSYLSWLEMLLNVLFSDVPIEFTAAMIAIEMPAAMRPYSMAVAAVSSFTNRRDKLYHWQTPPRYLVARADNNVALNLRPSERDN
jgi:hypothetical protein